VLIRHIYHSVLTLAAAKIRNLKLRKQCFLARYLSVTPQPNWSIGRVIVEVYRSHTIRKTHPIGLLWTSDQLVAVPATYTTHNKHKFPVFSGIRTRDPSSETASHCIATGNGLHSLS